jgi:microcystin degradation protein MlrC
VSSEARGGDLVPLRLGIAALWHETNTFAPGRTTLDDFRAYRLADGARAVRAAHAGTETELGGALAACEALAYEAVPLFSAAAVPGPIVEADAYAELRARLLDRLEEAGRLDGLLLALHGGMVVEGLADPESDLLAALRERAGSLPIAVVLDLHANPGDGLLEDSDLLLAYETYPHVDAAERAAQAVGLLAETIEGSLAPLVTGRRLPLLTCPLAQATAAEPMASLLARARSLEARPGVARASLVPGFAYADVERLGFAVVVAGEDEAANAAADELAAAVWERRDGFRAELAGIEEAVEAALAAPGPFVLADVGDNVGGGAPGDSTVLLRALLDAGAKGAVVVLHDPAGATAEGEVELAVGTPPLALRGRARPRGPARYRRSGSYMTGTEVDLGRCSVVEVEGVEVVLTERRAMPFDADHLRAVGIEPAERRVLVVKSALAWQGGFAGLAAGSLEVDTPGPTTCRLGELPYASVRRPIAPLDAI